MKKQIAGILALAVMFAGTAVAGSGELTDEQQVALQKLENSASTGFTAKWNDNVIRYAAGVLSEASDKSPRKIAIQFARQNKTLLSADAAGLKLAAKKISRVGGAKVVQLGQMVNGVPVIGKGVTVRVKDGIVTSIANNTAELNSVASRPEISKRAAVNAAKKAVNLTENPTNTILAVFTEDENTNLVYQIDFPVQYTTDPTRYRVMVDAITGGIVDMENRIMHDGPTTGSGLGMDGQVKQLDTYLYNGQYFLANPLGSSGAVSTYTANQTTSLPGARVTDADNYFTDPAAVEAHYNANATVDFFLGNFGRFDWYVGSGFQGSGGLVSTVHYDVAYDNAFWDGSQMVYGDGDVYFYPLSGAMDVVAHEIAHGVTEAVNNLRYCKESGALNESWSDVIGMLVSIENNDDYPYLLAEDIMKIAEQPGYEHYYALRSMSDPTFRGDAFPENDYNPAAPLDSWGQPAHTSEQYLVDGPICLLLPDYGGVHINSGIPNRAAYLVLQGIGAAKTQQIYYLAMFYMTSTAQFTDGRAAVELATIDLYGDGAELDVVQAAFTAVGIN